MRQSASQIPVIHLWIEAIGDPDVATSTDDAQVNVAHR